MNFIGYLIIICLLFISLFIMATFKFLYMFIKLFCKCLFEETSSESYKIFVESPFFVKKLSKHWCLIRPTTDTSNFLYNIHFPIYIRKITYKNDCNSTVLLRISYTNQADQYVVIMPVKESNNYKYVNLSKGHICSCSFNSTAEAINDLNKYSNITHYEIMPYDKLMNRFH